jgi:hypothetical protein
MSEGGIDPVKVQLCNWRSDKETMLLIVLGIVPPKAELE